MKEKIVVGKITNTHGLRGEVRYIPIRTKRILKPIQL